MLPRNIWYRDYTEHFWPWESLVILIDIDWAMTSAENALISEKMFWE